LSLHENILTAESHDSAEAEGMKAAFLSASARLNLRPVVEFGALAARFGRLQSMIRPGAGGC
jgi:hypothetical protein